jgi:adenylate cyclase
MNKYRYFYLIATLSVIVFAIIQLRDPPLIRDLIESKTYDLRLQLRNLVQKQPPANDIAIVMVDEKSIAEVGRWPWSREVQARLVDRISSGKPKVIGIDIMYSEPENPEADGRLARTIKRAGNVVQATDFFIEQSGQQKGEPAVSPDFLWDAAFMEVKTVPGIKWKDWAVKPERVSPPIREIATAATLGHVTNVNDMDGVLRSDIMYVNYGDDCYPSFPLQVARIAAGIPMKDTALYGGSGIQLGNRFIRTDLSGRVLINYRGRENSFPHISAVDLLKSRISPNVLRGRIVLLGTSARGTYDQKVTPFSANYPGVEKNASVVDNILTNNFIKKSPGVVEVITIVFTGIVLITLLPRFKATPGVILAFGLMGCYTLVSCFLIIRHNIWLSFVVPSANMAVIFTAGTISRLFIEERRAREIRAMFSSYVTERLVDEMIRHPEMARLGGEKREVTVLFSDVRGFTSYSENHPPEEVVAILNEYLGAMTEIVLGWEGILDKFIGDAIVVFWGAPMRQDDHAQRALGCALAMQERLLQLQEKWKSAGKAPLSAGIGINTGEAIVGNIGAEGKKMDYTVIGDQVNLGARVESLTRRYDASILMTEYTLENLRPALSSATLRGMAIRGIERVIVKGKDTPVGIYTVSPLGNDAPADVVECDPARIVRLTEK